MEKKKCPQCGEPIEAGNENFKPFCSERCKLIDLGNWASGKYRIAGRPVDPEEFEAEMATTRKEDER